jgi:hypothetical protein
MHCCRIERAAELRVKYAVAVSMLSRPLAKRTLTSEPAKGPRKHGTRRD